MPNWNGTLLTAKGRSLQAKVEAGAAMNITKLKIGDGTLGGGQTVDALTDLLSPKKNLGISALTPLESGVCKITAVVTNAGLTAGFYVRELGIFAQDPDLGEILYAYTADGSPDYLPAEGGTVAVAEELVVQLVFSNAANIKATISLDGLITTAILNAHKNSAVIDHPDGSVTDAKIGNRTITDTTTAAATSSTLTAKLSQLGYMIKAVTGGAAWYTAPVATIVTLFGKFNTTTGHKHTGGADDAPQIGTTGIADSAVTDAKIGTRMISDTTVADSGSGTLTNLFGKMGYMIKGITGKANWYTSPSTTLETANTHMAATVGIHGATNANTANSIVQRDASGNFIAGTITAVLNGLAATATKLATARTIALSGKITGTATTFDGSGNIVIPVTAVTADSCSGNAATATKLGTARTISLTGDVTGNGTFDGSGNLSIAATVMAGMPLGFTFSILANTPPAGCLALQGALVSRTAYPDLWAWVQANAPLITESAWQIQAAAQSSIGAYSLGDGSTTFRLPKIVDFVRGSDATRMPGAWQMDAMQNVTGQFGAKAAGNNAATGPFYSLAISGGSSDSSSPGPELIGFDLSRAARTADETHPKSISMLWCVKAFGAAVNQGTVDLTALAADVASKVSQSFLTANLVTNGNLKIPVKDQTTGAVKNFIMQWGTYVNTSGSATAAITLPIEFPTAFLIPFACLRGSSYYTGNASCYADIISTSQIRVVIDENSGGPSNNIFWLAIGC